MQGQRQDWFQTQEKHRINTSSPYNCVQCTASKIQPTVPAGACSEQDRKGRKLKPIPGFTFPNPPGFSHSSQDSSNNEVIVFLSSLTFILPSNSRFKVDQDSDNSRQELLLRQLFSTYHPIMLRMFQNIVSSRPELGRTSAYISGSENVSLSMSVSATVCHCAIKSHDSTTEPKACIWRNKNDN